MIQASLQSTLTCVPPALLDYPSRTYNLETIAGVPTDEDVKEIHDVIRALRLFLVPEMYDPGLSTQLARHLFNVQLAVYRSEYPLSILSMDTTFTPLTIPSNIPISLEPIIEAPSNEQVHSIHKAIHAVESMANTSFTFDPMLGTMLSQHLFNTQLVRYLQDSMQVQSTQAHIPTHASLREESPHNVPDPEAEAPTNNQQEVQGSPLIASSPHRETHSESGTQIPVETEPIAATLPGINDSPPRVTARVTARATSCATILSTLTPARSLAPPWLSVSALYDSNLSTQLAQYLSTIQMAIYRNEYLSSVVSEEHTYMPPSIPSHIPVSLQPVVGAPSEEEIETAHSVVCTLENLANSCFFDPALSVKLSQHVFSIQIARYIQDLNQGYLIQKTANLPSPRANPNTSPSSFSTGPIPIVVGWQLPQDVGLIQPTSSPPTVFSKAPPVSSTPVPLPLLYSNDRLDKISETQVETNRLLSVSEELLKGIRRTLVSTHLTAHQRPAETWRDITKKELAGYLIFYDIGSDLIDDETGDVKVDEEAVAQNLFANYLYYGHLPVSRNV